MLVHTGAKTYKVLRLTHHVSLQACQVCLAVILCSTRSLFVTVVVGTFWPAHSFRLAVVNLVKQRSHLPPCDFWTLY
jgi:hypothetical protein